MPSCRVYSPLQPRNAILSASRALRVKSSAHYLVLPLNPADRSTLLTLSPKQPTKSDPLTPVFSVQLARFSSLLVTLAKITPAFPHTSEKHPGVAPPLLHKKKNASSSLAHLQNSTRLCTISLSPSSATLPQNTLVTPFPATLPFSLDLKSFACHTSAKRAGIPK